MAIGWIANDLYENYNYHRKYDGLYFQNQTYSNSKETAYSVDKFGDWVCINVRGMSFDRAIETCQHEAGHEIFAEISEAYPEKIRQILKELEDGK